MSWADAWHSLHWVELGFAIGAVLFVALIRGRRFEWMLARRYLALPKERSPRAHVITLSFGLLWLFTQGLSAWMDHAHTLKVQEFR